MVSLGKGKNTLKNDNVTLEMFREDIIEHVITPVIPSELFDNNTTNHISAGLHEIQAAIRSIHTLAIIELICIAVGIFAVLFLPKIHKKKEFDYETGK